MKKISVFLSSSMTGELNAERESLKTLFSSDPILKEFYDFYSIDEHASPREIQEAYIDEVKEKDIFLLLLNEDLRPAVYEEYNTALKKKKTFFCYIKANSPNRNPELVKFIDCEIYKHHPAHYSDTQDLWKRVNNDFKSDLTRSYFNKLDDSVNEEKVEYVKYRASTADSIYRYFPLEELIKISKQEKILNLTVDQLIALSYSSLKDSGNYKLAILFLEVGLLKNPENWILYNNRGQILDEIGLSNNAIFSYNKAIQYNPKSDTAYYNLGNNYFSIGKYDKALSCYFKALDIDPNKGNATSGISSCYLRLEDVANSLIWSQRAYDMLKDEISITNLALTFSLNNQPDKALNLLNELKSNTLR
jgi:tetratricopeptide (TPR) repeat protein